MKKKKKKDLETISISNDKQFRSIKVPLNSVIRNSNNLKLFNNYAEEINKLVTLGYQLVRLFLLSKHKEGQLPDINEQLYETALSIILNSEKKPRKSKQINIIRSELTAFYLKHFRPLIEKENLPKLTNVSTTIQKLRVEMYTSFRNNIIIHYYKRLSRVLGVILETNMEYSEKEKKEQRKIHSRLLKDLVDKTNSLPEFKTEIEQARIYLPDLGEDSLGINLLKETNKFIKPTFMMADLLESRDVKLFQSSPLRKSEIPKHFPINSITLVNLLSCDGVTGTKRIKNKTELSKQIGQDDQLKWILWNSYFKLDKKIFRQKGYNFCYSIDTDGFCCTLKFIKHGYNYEKYTKKQRHVVWVAPLIEDLSQEMKDEIISKFQLVGGDPGKEILLQLINKDGVTLRYTIKQRYVESRFYKYRDIRHQLRLNTGILKQEEQLHNYKSTSMNIDKFKEYIKIKAKVSLEVIKHYSQFIYRKLKFRSQIFSKNSINNFLNQIEKTYGKDVVIAYGNWSRSSQMRGLVPTPGTTLKRSCAERFKVLDTNEFGTSKYCHYCHKEVKNFYYKGRKIHRVLMCKECSGPQGVAKVRFMHRDINGSANIEKLGRLELLGLPRPAIFCRQTTTSVPYPGVESKSVNLNLVKKVPIIIKKNKTLGRKAVSPKEMV